MWPFPLTLPVKQPTRHCRSCGGTGERHTGVDESPTTICKPCDGTGQIAMAEQPAQLAQPEQGPVAWAYVNCDGECEQIEYCKESPMAEFIPLYTSPPKREWVGLTDEEVQAIHDTYYRRMGFREFHQHIEAKLKEKNT